MTAPAVLSEVSSEFVPDRVTVGVPEFGVERLLWGVVIVASAADVALTLVGVSLCFSEANPVAALALEAAGGAGLVGLKTAAILALLGVSRRVGPTYRRVALVAFSLPQLFAVGHNTLLLARYAPACL